MGLHPAAMVLQIKGMRYELASLFFRYRCDRLFNGVPQPSFVTQDM
jgi:hypothetical protein